MKTQILLALTHHWGPQSQTYLGHKQLRACFFFFFFSPDPWIISSSKHQPARKRREVAGCLFPANSNGIPWPGHTVIPCQLAVYPSSGNSVNHTSTVHLAPTSLGGLEPCVCQQWGAEAQFLSLDHVGPLEFLSPGGFPAAGEEC